MIREYPRWRCAVCGAHSVAWQCPVCGVDRLASQRLQGVLERVLQVGAVVDIPPVTPPAWWLGCEEEEDVVEGVVVKVEVGTG